MSQFRVKKSTPEKGNVIEAARRRCDEVMDAADTVVLSFSGGKDSTAAMEMLVEAHARADRDDKIHLVHVDDEVVPPETVEFMHRVCQRDRVKVWWCCLPVKYRNGCSWDQPWWYPWNPQKEDKWVRPMPDLSQYDDDQAELVTLDHPRMQEFEKGEDEHSTLSRHLFCLDHVPINYGKILEATGIRASESLARLRGILQSDGYMAGKPYTNRNDGSDVEMARPVYDWSDDDLWKAVERFGWDYNRTYDVLAKLGVPKTKMRTSHPYSEEAMKDIWWYQEGWPDLWDRAKHRVPGAAAAGEHGDDLFSVKKKDGESWYDVCVRLFNDIDDEEIREQQRSKINTRLQRHQSHSTTPMQNSKTCPYCGDSWRRYAKMLYRGDLKGRRTI